MISHLFLSKFFVASEAPKSRNSRLGTGPVFNPSAFIPLVCPADFMTLAIKNHREERKERLAHSAVASCWAPVVPGAARPPSSSLPPAWNKASPNFTWPDSLTLSRAFWPWFICWWAARRLSPFLSDWFRDGSGTALYLFSWDYSYFIILPVGSHLGLYCLFEDGDIYSFSHRTPRCFLWGSQHPPPLFLSLTQRQVQWARSRALVSGPLMPFMFSILRDLWCFSSSVPCDSKIPCFFINQWTNRVEKQPLSNL